MQPLNRKWRDVLLPSVGLLMVAGFLTSCGFVIQPRAATAEQPSKPLTDGKVLYEAHCASCHGIKGEGQPDWQIPDAKGVFPAPPHNSEGHTWHHPDQLLLEITANGGSLPNSKMPGFADSLSREQMEAILAYIKTFWDVEQRGIQADVSQRWKQQNQ
jgi:mono/diheme cytochrome c family protein